jgi:hypothetical protein
MQETSSQDSLQLAQYDKTKAYSQTDINVGCYQRPQKGQMTSTMVEYLQGIQTAKEAAD